MERFLVKQKSTSHQREAHFCYNCKSFSSLACFEYSFVIFFAICKVYLTFLLLFFFGAKLILLLTHFMIVHNAVTVSSLAVCSTLIRIIAEISSLVSFFPLSCIMFASRHFHINCDKQQKSTHKKKQ